MELAMDKIVSFQKDHIHMAPGFTAQDRHLGTITYDLRFVKPNHGRYIEPDAMHSIEHLLAVGFRCKTRLPVVYVGPMGCMTGLYLVLSDGIAFDIALKATYRVCEWALKQESVPGATEMECGNYKFQNLDRAKSWIQEYMSILMQKGKEEHIDVTGPLYAWIG